MPARESGIRLPHGPRSNKDLTAEQIDELRKYWLGNIACVFIFGSSVLITCR
jgi:hypothetical protein